jgi:4-amino-4-deoxy-L-arabinose transferase-like glycosyltransferase
MPRRVYLLCLLFILALLPVAGSFIRHHPDEQHLPDAAMSMLESGDFITPRTGNGEMRMRKPILAYWVEAGSFALLGVSPLSVRLPYLIQGAAVVAFTAVLALRVTRRRRAALLAAAVMACQLQLVYVSVHALSDVMLTMWVLLAAIGFVAMALPRAGASRPVWAPWLAYGAVGLGVATKGMLPLAFLAVVLIWVILDWRCSDRAGEAPPFDRLWHGPAVLAGIVLGAAWYVAVFLLHRREMFDDFVGDQFIRQVGSGATDPLRRGPVTALGLAAGFAPFLLLLPELWWRRRTRGLPTDPPSRHVRRYARLAWMWAFVVVLIFAFAPRLTWRYEAPALPLLAVVLAGALCRADYGLLLALLRRARWISAAVLAMTAAIGFVVHAQVASSSEGFAVAGLGLALAGGVMWLGSRGKQAGAAIGFALSILVIIGYGFVCIRPALGLEQSQEIAQALTDAGIGQGCPVLYLGKPAAASKLRVRTQGRYAVTGAQAAVPLDAFDAVVVDLNDAPPVDLTGWTVREVEAGLVEPRAGDIWDAVLAGELRSYLESHRGRYRVAVRKRS